jgi:hypothetical protein
MKTRIVVVTKGYVPQVWKSTGRTTGMLWWSKPVYEWSGVCSELTTFRFPDLQLSYCVVKTQEEAQLILDQYKKKEEEKKLDVTDLFLLSSN